VRQRGWYNLASAEAKVVLQSIGWPEVIGALSFVVGVVVPIWIAMKARPLGSLPYRWGVYTGIQMAITAVVLFVLGFSTLGRRAAVAGSILVLIGIVAALGAMGTLRRKRWGALLSIVMLVVLLVVPFFSAVSYAPQTQQPWQAIPILIVLIVNVFYFKKRWRALG
jgi:hypothetical protein